MNKFINTFTLNLFFLVGCSSPSEEKYSSNTLNFDNVIKFELDSLTPNTFQALEIFENEETTYLSFLNNVTNTIYYYNFEDQKLEKTLKYEVGGDGLRNGIMSYNHFSNDSILLFGTGLFSYISNLEGKVLKGFKLIDMQYQQSPYASSQSSPIILDNNIYYNSLVWGNYLSNYKPFMKYNLNSDKIELFGNLPSVYQNNGNWGSHHYDYIYQFNDKNNRRIIYSFPAANSLFEYQIDKDNLFEIKNSYTFKEIDPPFQDDKYIYDSEDWHLSMNSTEIYGSLLFDYDLLKVYRWYKLPIVSAQKNPKRETLLLVYDYPSMEFLKSYRLPDFKYVTENSFIRKNKIYVRVENNIEDEIEFQSFKIY